MKTPTKPIEQEQIESKTYEGTIQNREFSLNRSWPGLPELHKGLGGGADLPSN